MKAHILSGADRIDTIDAQLRGRRLGLMTNPTGINHAFRSTIDLMHEKYQLTALFAPEHGIRGDIQAGEQVADTVDAETGVRVFSAYGAAADFTEEMLAAFDVLVFDIQDVGARFYTYLYSLSHAMRACAAAGKAVVVLDRVNPQGGLRRGGTVLDPRFASFVGNYELPTLYGLTIGEFALYAKDYLRLDLPLTVVELAGWKREMLLDDTDLLWVAPSPNCPDLAAALCYPGTCVFEGTSISEGRGTTLPFQMIGAPFLNGAALECAMNRRNLPGLHFRRVSFCPTFSKHAGELCHGVQMHITDRQAADPILGALCLLDEARAQAPEQVTFRPSASGGFFIDKLLGTDEYRAGGLSAEELIAKHRPKVEAFAERAHAYERYA